MSTRSAIIHKTASGYAGIYCHFDGYLEHNGQILHDHYQSQEKVAELIALGDISILEAKVAPDPKLPHRFDGQKQNGVVLAYHRDRGEKWEDVKPKEGKSAAGVADQIGHNGEIYVFENGEWTHNGADLAEELKMALAVKS